ncbi:transthyretin-like family protein [Limnoglobus roseus]|uniref:Carboxypeptidase regulatory-like domain-containing protein n=1 Tax=Limnoglobus roseus TaxID=2598579 RepID=A0A5C1AEC6_9BACT|nr:carboxypeptidase regulatory-like domain-containing protein [Limnoglobus roseus]QEL16072.1 carboxypeptidase regulatory-like domain-containing protein [Limnoglobus roseus]
MLTRKLVGLILLCALVLPGCGGDGPVVPVSGTLSYKGKPVANAYVHFVPQKGRPSMGSTDADGRFELSYDPQTKGAERGKHRVFVQFDGLAAQSKPGAIPGKAVGPPADQKAFFDKYSGSNSKVEVTVEKAESGLKLDWD